MRHARTTALAVAFLVVSWAALGEAPLTPVIDGEWWQVAGNADLGQYSRKEQEPVDFGVWQAADGTWELWSCIRNTAYGGHTRLFYRWEGQNLTDKDWKPMGIAMTADPQLGETPGGLQAPYVLGAHGTYWMFYGDWRAICLAQSDDGKQFRRALNRQGRPQLFSEDIEECVNTRDPMVLSIGGTYACYYTAFPHNKGAVYCRTSMDLRNWSPSKVVAFGGAAGTGICSAECPQVVYHEPSGCYYLFRTQLYGEKAETRVYRSKDPMNFGIEDDRFLVGLLPVAAPEIIRHDGQWYMAALLPSLKGIRIAKLDWTRR
jgi:hypothetical protein